MDSSIFDILKKKDTKVKLSNIDLNEVPYELKDCDWIEELDISNNLIEKLDNLPTSLRILNCSSNLLDEIDLDAEKYPNLEKIYFQQNAIKYFELSEFKKLDYVDASNNALSTLFSEQFPDSLTTLKAVSCNICQINLENTSIKNLFLGDNEIEELSSETLPISISILNVNNNCLTDESKVSLKCFDVLSDIRFDNNDFTVVPVDVPDDLNNLSLQNNEIELVSVLPPGLKRIDLEKNKIHTFTAWQENLEEVYLENNKLKELVGMNDDLQTLMVSDNLISYIDRFPLRLETIDLNDNKLKTIPKLNYNLDDINLENNLLISLPKPLPLNLTCLNISNNMFTHDPLSYMEQQPLNVYEYIGNPFNDNEDDFFNEHSDSDDNYEAIFGMKFDNTRPKKPYYMTGKPIFAKQRSMQQYSGKTYSRDLWNFELDEKNKVKLFGREEI